LSSPTIAYETANLPVVEAFDVIALDATHMRATWQVSDVEGLAGTPIDLEVTTNGVTWDPLAVGVGNGPTGSIDLPAPSSPYIVRLTVTDRAGNRGVRGFSDLINAPGWSIYAGSPDHAVGGAARSLELAFGENSSYKFAVEPATLDAYAWDRDTGIIRIDGATGQTEKLIGISNPNLPDDGQLPVDATVQFDPSLQFGPDGMLYISAGRGTPELNSAVIYQIDPRTRHVRRYLGGGTGIDATATPATVFVSKWAWTFDEDGSLYFLTSCTPGSLPNPNRMRLMKVTRQPDGTAGALSVIAGNCVAGAVPSGVDATTAPLGVFTQYPNIGSLAVFDHGRMIYIAAYPGIVRKITDGLTSASDLPVDTTGGLAYDARTGQILIADGAIRAFTPNRTAPTEQPAGIVVAETGTGACAVDGVPAADACVHVGFTMQSTPDRLYFSDGEALNEYRTYRLRFVDRDGLVRTYAGSMPLHGGGLPRRLARARFSGIAYKPATAPNQSAFPAGLYFADPFAVALGRIDETTERLSIVWGNQSGTPRAYTTGDAMGPDVSLGRAYAGGTLTSLALGPQGIPIVRYGLGEGRAHLITADASGHAVVLQTGSTLWESAPDGTNPAQLEMWPYGAV
jgi:hypothetical protein